MTDRHQEAEEYQNDLSALTRLHVTQDFDNQPRQDIEEVVRSLSILPNEMAYVVDCRSAEVEIFGNVGSIGSKGFSPNCIDDLFELFSTKHREAYLAMMTPAIKSIVTNEVMLNQQSPEELVLTSIFNGSNNKKILRRSFITSLSSENNIEYSAAILTDVTHLVQSSKFSYNFSGPQSKDLYCCINDIKEYRSLLSHREVQILKSIGNGWNSQMIADHFFISKHTVDRHRKNILKKLEANNSIQAYQKAMDMGLMKY